MESVTIPVSSWIYLAATGLLWIYFFINAARVKLPLPYGFVIVPVGVFISSFRIQIELGLGIPFSVNLALLICLLGFFFNIGNIEEQFNAKDFAGLMGYAGLGILSGVVFGLISITMNLSQNASGLGEFLPVLLISNSMQNSIAEEFLFRGFFLNYLRTYGFHSVPAILVQSILFTVLHFPRFSTRPWGFGIVFMIGLVSGFLAWKSKNLIPCFLLHILVNLMVLITILN